MDKTISKTLIFVLGLVLAFDVAAGMSLAGWPDGFEVHFLDVGQGDAVLLRSPEGHNVLVDGGPGNAVLLELAGEIPYLFPEIDLLVLTHPHADHVEGLVPVLERFEVGAVLMSAPEYESRVYNEFLQLVANGGGGSGGRGPNGRGRDLQVYFAEEGVDFELGGMRLDVLYPFEPVTGEKMGNVNNASPVILVEFTGCDSPPAVNLSSFWRFGKSLEAGSKCDGELGRVLLTGDAELEVEEAVLEAAASGRYGLNLEGDFLDVDVLKAGHHGSRTASSWEFLSEAAAELMVISVGEGNSFEHPHEEILERAAELGMEVRRTDLEGRVSIEF
jgi:competence protein ComEC